MRRYFKRIFSEPPIVFPLLAAFHLFALIYTVAAFGTMGLSGLGWLQILWMVAYCVAWFFCTELKKSAAYVYIALSLIDLALRYTTTGHGQVSLYCSPLAVITLLFSVVLLIFFKRLR